MRSVRLSSLSEDDTRRIGSSLAAAMHGGEIVGLRGELGAGKTVLVRGLAEGLGISARKVRSPTFTLINEYSGGRLPLYHLDLYRMELTGVDSLALRDYLYGDGVCVVEWSERMESVDCALDIQITFVGTSERMLVVTASDPRYDDVLNSLVGG